MKKIVCGEKLQEKILESINLLCGTVKQTLGPKGGNVIIDHSNFSPFITNDGVTIAKNIESEDEVVAAILEIIKEASIKTDEEVGDGTTTTLVLLESLYEKSIEYINKGLSPIVLKRELDQALSYVLKELQKEKWKATTKELKRIAVTSANDEKLGELAYQVFQKVKTKRAITIREVNENRTKVDYLKGYFCGVTPASVYFFKDVDKLSYNETYILLMNTAFTNLENISFLLNEMLNCKKNLVIIADSFDDQLVEETVALCLTNNLNICLLKIEEYGAHINKIFKDLECIMGTEIVENENKISSRNISIVRSVEITKENLRIDFKIDEKIKQYLTNLKKERKLMKDDLENEFYDKRIAMFSHGIAEIELGAPTKIEGIEKRMRLEDALCALESANNGVVIGEGISLLRISKNLRLGNEATEIWKETLRKPFEQILINAGLNFEEIFSLVEKNKYDSVFNVTNQVLEEKYNTSIIDSFKVVEQSLINATSIAGLLLTTTSLIINEYQNNLNKESEYSRW